MYNRAIISISTTVKPPIKDSLRGGHNRNNLSTKDKMPERTCPLFRGSTVLLVINSYY